MKSTFKTKVFRIYPKPNLVCSIAAVDASSRAQQKLSYQSDAVSETGMHTANGQNLQVHRCVNLIPGPRTLQIKTSLTSARADGANRPCGPA